MANKMIIDASHPEETRVVVLRGNRVEEFDFESASKKQLRGNIYLAKVTRVEPSLQAAFVEYGGNRHGFLAFSEIHPDYYQIPHSDRAALIEEETRAHREEDEDETTRRRSRRHRRGSEKRRPNDDERVSGEANLVEAQNEPALNEQEAGQEQPAAEYHEVTEARDEEGRVESAEPAPQEFVEASQHGFAPDQPQPHTGFEPSFEPAFAVDSITVEVVAETAPAESFQPQESPSQESQPEVQQTEAVAQESAAHSIVHDPEGFAVVEEGESDEDSQEDDSDDEFENEEPELIEPRSPTFHDEEQSSDESGQTIGEASHGDEEEAPRARRFVAEPDHNGHDDHNGDAEEEEIVEQLGGDAMDETPYRQPRLRRQYKIQEVIKRRQVLLIQVVKEERGNKGAALTTYLSLAGRYSVLMPNTARGGGISRKITDAGDRKRLKEIAQELEVPEGMGVILRTAGASRTKPEVKRDFEYLMRMWETVRELTLSSSAPALVYEEGSLIKRAIRDLYNKDIDDVVVAGEAGYREARDFMRLLMPTHVKNVQAYRDPQPIFAKWGAEAQLDALFHNQVTLKSGGYIVINQTEALVAIDVNSGRSTREHNIEDTALRTNLEAADEVARQLRLRDLAGLIVVDFIDMEESRNNRSVERRIKEALKDDRARIQVGRISHFGLLEMSRQRIRTGVLEGSSVLCPHCAGAGTVRSTASVAVHVIRVLEDALIKNAAHNIILRTRTDIALYILNQKRALLSSIEERFGVSVTVEADDTLSGSTYHALERGELATGPIEGRPDPLRRNDPRRNIDDSFDAPNGFEAEAEVEDEVEAEAVEAEVEGEDDRTESTEAENENKRRRRRRRGRGRGFERENGVESDGPQPSDAGLAPLAELGGDLSTPVEPVAYEERAGSEGENGENGEAGENGQVGENGEERRRGRGRWRRRGRGGNRNVEPSETNGEWRPSGEEAGVTEGSVEGSSEDQAAMGEFAGQETASEQMSSEASAAPQAPEADAPEAFTAPAPQQPVFFPAFVETAPAVETPAEPVQAEAAPESTPAPVAAEAPVETPVVHSETPVAPQPEAPAPVEAPQAAAPSEPVVEPAPAPVAPPAPPRQPELPAITKADPAQPKRSGWWARAKANFTGN